jgi:peptide/nickel transport system permease protein
MRSLTRAFGPSMPDAPTLSPSQLAIQRFWSTLSVRLATWALAAIALLAIYAPFLASEVALVWVDGDGLRLPLIVDLFNRGSYDRAHDLLFSILALLLPVFALCWWLLRRRWTVARRLAVGTAVLVGLWLAAMLMPIGTGWRTLWDYRPASPCTSSAVAAARPAELSFVLFAPVPHRVGATYPGVNLAAPGVVNPATKARFWIGADVSGRDVMATMLFGARISLTIGLVATGLSLLIGVIIGAISGYVGGTIDLLLQRVVEIMMCFPRLILVLTVVAMTSRSIFVIMLVLGLTGWAGTARLVRGEFLAQTVRDYVVAAEAIGVSRWGVMFRHILPNTMAPLIITGTFGIAGAVLTESELAFIGLGDPTSPSWGLLLNEGRENIHYAWLIYAPGLAVFVLVTCLNLIGNGLRDAFDPKSER